VFAYCEQNINYVFSYYPGKHLGLKRMTAISNARHDTTRCQNAVWEVIMNLTCSQDGRTINADNTELGKPLEY
jgi:hypothetical protein